MSADMILVVTVPRAADRCDAREAILDFMHYSARMSFREIWHGACPTGVDAAAAEICADNKNLRVRAFPANWTEHGKAAGPIRNREMMEAASLQACQCVHVLALPMTGEPNRGTRSAINEAIARGLGLTVEWMKGGKR